MKTTTKQAKRYVMRMKSGYAYASLQTLENVVVSESDCKQARYCGQHWEPSVDSKPFCKFRIGKRVFFQLAQYCELTDIRDFSAADIVDGQFPRIYCDRSELVSAPLWYHLQGLQQTSSGYGAKLVTSLKICFEGRLYRVYCTCYGNNGSSWFMVKGRKIYVD